MRRSIPPLLFFGLACGHDGPAGLPDMISPVIEVVFPSGPSQVDRDEDGLVDLEIRVRDSLSGVDAGSWAVTANRLLKGSVGSNDLLAAWRVEKADRSGLVLEELPDALLPRGRTEITVRVADAAGNPAHQSLKIELPPLSFHRRVEFDTPPTYFWPTRLVGHPSDGRLVVTQALVGTPGTSVVIVDARSIEPVAMAVHPVQEVLNLALDARRNRVYLADYQNDDVLAVSALDGTLVHSVADADPWGGGAVALDIADHTQELYRIPSSGGFFFADSPSVAFIGVADLETGTRTRFLRLPFRPEWGYDVRFVAAALDELSGVLYIGTADWTSSAQGVLKVDAHSGDLLQQIDVVPEDPGRLGGIRDMRRDGEHIVAVSESYHGRILRLLSGHPTRIQRGDLGSLRPMRVAITPDSVEYVVLAGRNDAGPGRILQIVDAASLHPVWQDTTAPPGEFWDAAFRSDGNLLFVGGVGGDLVGSVDGEPVDPGPLTLLVYLYR